MWPRNIEVIALRKKLNHDGVTKFFMLPFYSDRENYFWSAGQNVRQAFSNLPDILRPCQTFFPVDDWQISEVNLVFLVGHFLCIKPCWTKCPARSGISAGQKSARHFQLFSRSLPFLAFVTSLVGIWGTTVNAALQNEMSVCISLLKLDVWQYVLVYIGLQMNY